MATFVLFSLDTDTCYWRKFLTEFCHFIKPINLQLVVMIAVRKALDKVFTSSELKILDDILPHFTRHERLDDEASHLRTDSSLSQSHCQSFQS